MQLSELKGKKICVTGATGFLGSHLVPKLLAADCLVTCLCRSSHPKLPAQANIIQGELTSGQGVKKALKGQDIIIHLASALFGLHWQDYLKANVAAAQNIVTILKDSPAKVIFISSLAAAGPCATQPGKNEDEIAKPVSAYGWSKLLCENIFTSALGKRAIILRPAIIYGSGDRGLLPVFKSANNGIAVSPGFGRSFPVSAIHVSDAADAIMLVCAKSDGTIYHLSDGKFYDMDIFNKAIGKALGRKNLHIFHVPLPIMAASACAATTFSILNKNFRSLLRLSPVRPSPWNLDKFRESKQVGWLANNSKIHSELGFTAKISMEAGMEEAVAGYRAARLL